MRVTSTKVPTYVGLAGFLGLFVWEIALSPAPQKVTASFPDEDRRAISPWTPIGWREILDLDAHTPIDKPQNITFIDTDGKEHTAFVACKRPDVSFAEEKANILQNNTYGTYFVVCLPEQ